MKLHLGKIAPILVFLTLLFKTGFCQFPNNIVGGSPTTLDRTKGAYGSDSGYVYIYGFPDTASANRGFLKNVAGLVIRVSNKLYLRASNAQSWIEIGSGGGGGAAIDTSNKWVNRIEREVGKDSIIYYIGGTRFAIKDSAGGGVAINLNMGFGMEGQPFVITDSGNISIDSVKIATRWYTDSQFYNSIAQLSDTSYVSLRPNGTKDTIEFLIEPPVPMDTSGKWVNRIEREVGKDSIIYYIGGTRFAIKDSIGGGASVDTSSLSNRINLKVNISDTASMLSPYLRSNIAAATYSTISVAATKVNVSDTASMLSPYLRSNVAAAAYVALAGSYSNPSWITALAWSKLTGTPTTLSGYGITNGVSTSDTSVFARKSTPAYSMKANNTSGTADETNYTFKNVAQQTYSGTISWTGTTAPSGATAHTYKWSQIGNVVTLLIYLDYASAGSALTQCTMALPSDCPAPYEPTGTGAASDLLIFGSGALMTNRTTATTTRVVLRVNSGDTGWELNGLASSGSFRYANFTITYFTN